MKQINEREQKINALKAILTGRMQAEDLNRPDVVFIELSTKEDQPGLYFNKEGKSYTEIEKNELIKDAERKTDLVFIELKTL